jgi:hypothetical protein
MPEFTNIQNQAGKGGRAGLAKIFVGLSDGADQQKRRSSEFQ